VIRKDRRSTTIDHSSTWAFVKPLATVVLCFELQRYASPDDAVHIYTAASGQRPGLAVADPDVADELIGLASSL
jgi:hypothetical protein